MPESDELNVAIGHIKHKVDSMDRTLERLLRVNGKAMIADYLEQFRTDSLLGRIYLAIDGKKTQKELISEIGCSQPTISRRLQILQELDLIETIQTGRDGMSYQYTRMEKLFNISRTITKSTKDE
jgi:DNA-binding MarR family transcriptional regulator